MDMTTRSPTHRLECTPEEADMTYCLNGQCFAIPGPTGFERETACHCEDGWTEARCGVKEVGPVILDGSVPIPMIVGVSVLAILIGFIALAVMIYFLIQRRKRQRRNHGDRANNNNNVTKTDTLSSDNALLSNDRNGSV